MSSEARSTWLHRFVWLFAFAFALFHIYTAAFGVFQSIIQRSIHVGGGITLFLLLSIENVSAAKERKTIS